MTLFWVWLSALLFMTVVMIVAWFVQRAKKNAGWADPFWSFGFGIAGTGAALAPGVEGTLGARQSLVAAMVVLWAVRLGAFMAKRAVEKPEDGRYAEQRAVASTAFQPVMYLTLQVQAWVAALLATALCIAARNPAPALRLADFAGAALLMLAVAGEAMADESLRRFKAKPENTTAVFDKGLWAWSRHPNYVFEVLAWFSYALVAIDVGGGYPLGWVVLAAPALMLLLVTKVTGIPVLERSLVDSKGEAYRAYQARVSAFFPRPPRVR